MTDTFLLNAANPNDSLGSLLEDCLAEDTPENYKGIQLLNDYIPVSINDTIVDNDYLYKASDFLIDDTIEVKANEIQNTYDITTQIIPGDDLTEWLEPIYIKTDKGYLAIPRHAALRALSASDAQLNEQITAHLIDDLSEESSTSSTMEWVADGTPCQIANEIPASHDEPNVIMRACQAAGLEVKYGMDMLSNSGAVEPELSPGRPKKKLQMKKSRSKQLKKRGWPKGFPRKDHFSMLRPPKHPATACNMYVADTLAKLKDAGEPVGKDVVRAIISRWKILSDEEKEPFFEKAQEDKKRFLSEMAVFQRKYKEKEMSLIEEHKQSGLGLRLDDATLSHRFELLGPNLRCDLCDKSFTKLHSKYEHLKSKNHQNNVTALNGRLLTTVRQVKRKWTKGSSRKCNKEPVIDNDLKRHKIILPDNAQDEPKSPIQNDESACKTSICSSSNATSSTSTLPAEQSKSSLHRVKFSIDADIDNDSVTYNEDAMSEPDCSESSVFNYLDDAMENMHEAIMARDCEIEIEKNSVEFLTKLRTDLVKRQADLENDIKKQKKCMEDCQTTIDRLSSEKELILQTINSIKSNCTKFIPTIDNPKKIKKLPVKRLDSRFNVHKKEIVVNGRIYKVSVSDRS